jgi:hypothetical protein
MLWGHIQQYIFPGPPYGLLWTTINYEYILYIYTLPQGGPSKGILWGRLKEIHLNYTTMNACSEDVTASKAPYPLSMNILVLIYHLILLRGLPVNRSWCWSSPQLCAEHTAMLWNKNH